MKTICMMIIAFFITGFLLEGICFADDNNPPLPTPIGRVVWVKGTLTAIMPNKEERKLQRLSLIFLHDTLITDGQSYAQVVFTDNTLMTFRPDTKFFIKEYSYNPRAKKSGIGKSIMSLIEGGFRTITGLIAKNSPQDYQVNTPVATIGVRGTDYTVALLKNGEMYVGYYAGQPCVKSKEQGGGEVCLDTKTPYAEINSSGTITGLAQQPEVLKEKLEITPTTLSPFNNGANLMRNGGTVSSFCITQ